MGVAMKRQGIQEFFDELKGARVRPLAIRSVTHRVHGLLNTLVSQGQTVVLTGEPGNSKTRLAEEAAYLLATRLERPVHVLVLPVPPRVPTSASTVFSTAFPELFPANSEVTSSVMTPVREERADPNELASSILSHLRTLAGDAQIVLIAPRIDRYSPLSEMLLSELVRSHELRVIATTHRMSGAAARIVSDPRVRVIEVGPLSVEETADYLADLLGVDLIESNTLQRWHTTTGGNVFALTTLAHACERSGVIHRSRGVAWVDATDDAMPGELFDYLGETCTEEELRALEFVAVAGPIAEPVLMRRLDQTVVATLFERGLLVTLTSRGSTSLALAHPMLVASILANLPATERLARNDEIYKLLREDYPERTDHLMPDRLMRLVNFGLDGGHRLPISWLSTAFEMLHRGGGNPRLLERIALEMLSRPDTAAATACEAAIEARRLARLRGDFVEVRRVTAFMRSMLASPDRAVSDVHRVQIQLAVIQEDWWGGMPTEEALAALQELAGGARDSSTLVPQIYGTQAFILLFAGELRRAREIAERLAGQPEYRAHGMQSIRHFILAFVLQQQGKTREAIELAEHGRRLALLGEAPRVDAAEMNGFAMLLGAWVSGNTIAGRRMLEEFSHHTTAGEFIAEHESGLNDVAAALFAVRDGRWSDAAQLGEGLAQRLSRRDSYGVGTLVQTMLSLALAALGERQQAIRLLHSSRVLQPGLSQGLGGHVRVLRLRAMHWLHADELHSEAEEVINWSREQKLPLVELKALHVRACVRGIEDRETFERAEELASQIRSTVAYALLAHMQRIAETGVPLNHPEVFEARMLAELGVWLPLPASHQLTAREREVALHAAFGFSSRQIAEQLHISSRTVETHLGRVFTKLGLENRDDLRSWFGNEYEDPWETTRPPVK